MNEFLDAALSYAKRGWPVFPCRPDKQPYTTHGVLDATLDSKQIQQWWAKWPRANPAINVGEAGMVVLDFDPGHDKKRLEALLGEPIKETGLTQRTPRGGSHYFYLLAGKDDVISNTAGDKLSGHIDVRSFHGYVLLPPSRTADGKYAWELQGKPAVRQDRLKELANSYRAKSSDRDNWIIEPDLPEHVNKATNWLLHEAQLAIQGHGGDNCAYRTATMMKSFGISEAMAFDLMWEHWNDRCSPPWSADELEIKIKNGYSYNTSAPGNCTDAYHAAKLAAGFERVERSLPSGREFTKGRFRFVNREGMEHIKPAQWLVEGVLPEDGYAIMFGDPSSLKSFLAIDLALSVACGYPIDGLWSDRIIEPGPVLIAIGEGRPNFRERIRAWETKHWNGQRCPNIVLADPVPPVSDKAAWTAFCDGALAMHPGGYRLKVIDTIGRAMQGLNVNSQEHASKFTALQEHLTSKLGGATLALHHSGHEHKDREAGSYELRGACDTSLQIERAGKELAVTVTMRKQKDAPEWDKPLRIAFEEINLGEGKKSLTVVAKAPPKPQISEKQEEQSAIEVSAVYELLDHVVARVLSRFRERDFSQAELADLVAGEEDIHIGSKSLQNRYMTALRERKDLRSRMFYDASKRTRGHGRWRWVEPNGQ
jgi:hypothetical protein